MNIQILYHPYYFVFKFLNISSYQNYFLKPKKILILLKRMKPAGNRQAGADLCQAQAS